MTDHEDHSAPAPPTDDQRAWTAFAELNAGNERYRTMSMKHPQTYHEEMLRLADARHQKPAVCILGCADSRVPPEIIFDQGLGDMFVVRVAGNVSDDDAQASLEYAVQHFTPPPALIVVLGHESCGAVQAAAITAGEPSVPAQVKAEFKGHHKHSALTARLKVLAGQIAPAIASTRNPHLGSDHWTTRLDRAICQNVKYHVGRLQKNPVFKQKGTFIIGARYALGNGGIDWLTPLPRNPHNLAFGKAASQSSNFDDDAGARAVDGIADGNYDHGSVTHTQENQHAWWQVDLGESVNLDSIVLWNRTDCCGDRMGDYWVFVSGTPFESADTPGTLQKKTSTTWCIHQAKAPDPSTTLILPEGVRGRYVRVQLAGKNYLSLAEVQVMGTPTWRGR